MKTKTEVNVVLCSCEAPEAREQREWGLVRTYVQDHPWPTTRAVCQGAGMQAKRALAILKARAEAGGLVTERGLGGATLFSVPVSQVGEQANRVGIHVVK